MKVKLSEMYTVYWEYVEKAHLYVRKEAIHYLMRARRGMQLHVYGKSMVLFLNRIIPDWEMAENSIIIRT